jgi:hypothetical protein
MKKNNLERIEQIKLHNWCKINKILSFAVPNGGSRNIQEAVNLKAEGVVSGVSDYIVMLPNVILFIEMKQKPKRLKTKISTAHIKVSKTQKAFLKKINTFTYAKGFIAYGFEQAKSIIGRELFSL